VASDVIWLVRHAQSTANAGAPAANYPTIPLSELGWLQARSFVKRVPRAPERIVWSPFLRARQTAEPLLAQFPHVPTAELPVEEFSYLHFPGDRELTWQDRAPRVEAYWARQDPLHRDGGVGESYADLVERVRQFLHAARDWRGFQVVFSHRAVAGDRQVDGAVRPLASQLSHSERRRAGPSPPGGRLVAGHQRRPARSPPSRWHQSRLTTVAQPAAEAARVAATVT
jgi:broad specificity phosphatase PhoE